MSKKQDLENFIELAKRLGKNAREGLVREGITKPPRDHDEQMEIEYRRQQIIERAVSAADRIIVDECDGSTEEMNYVTGRVMLKFAEKATHPYNAAILKKDLGLG